MKIRPKIYHFLAVWLVVLTAGYSIAMPYRQDNKQRAKSAATKTSTAKTTTNKPAANDSVMAQPIIENEDTIPDSLLHPRWKIQRTLPITLGDLDQGSADLRRPDNLPQTVEYNDTLGLYVIGTKIGNTYLAAPVMMTPEEYRKWSARKAIERYFRSKNDEIYKAKGKEKFSFSDMHFDLGPAEKIFGPGGVRIKTQGTAELKLGATMKNIDNPSLPIRNRKTTNIDFDEKVNLSLNGKVGDKVNMNLNYNTDATFDFDAQNLKLKYDGKEDEIIKLVEAGNVSFPSNSSLVKGASSLFGLRTDLQFGKLKLQLVASQKKTSSKSVQSKGGAQFTTFEMNATNYEANRHFFLSHFFREKYDAAMRTLPNMTTGIKVNRVEVWVTNKTATTSNTRSVVALTDLGENAQISNPLWGAGALPVPANNANGEYAAMTTQYAAARDIDQTSTVLDGISGFAGGRDYEKLQNARLLNSSEYTINSALGYISLKSGLETDQVLAVAYEYTYGGQTYQVGEFAQDVTDVSQALFVKALKNTSNNPKQGNWKLMMKNVYNLGGSVEKEKFRLDVKFQSDTAGVYLSYLPETQTKDQPIIRALGADRLDNNLRAHANGYFDYVEGYTVQNGRVFFPTTEPFGNTIYQYMTSRGVSADQAAKYAFTELYDSTKTVAQQIAEKDKYIISGQFKGSAANVISLGQGNVPQGSVVVTAGGVTLTENSDYSVDYNAGEVTILNQSIIDAGTAINVSLESNDYYGQQRKTMFGMNWEYDFSKNFQLSGTVQHLSEQALTTKVNMGSEPLNNTLWGVNMNWKKESQWLTNMLDKIPFLHLTQPSSISFTGEFAHLIAGQSHGTQDNASYIDDFENTKNAIDISTPTSWFMSSVPTMFPESADKTSLASGYNRARLAWYTIDPLFTRRSSSLTPSHIKSDLDQLSNHYVREVPVRELFPQRNQNSYQGATSMLNILNLAYYPSERGPYNFNANDLQPDGTLAHPEKHWGGMMRKLDTNDFETANVEYVEFWMLDPFIYSRRDGTASEYGGDFYINLGEVSEDILRDGKKFYESGMPVDGSQSFVTTQWGKVPTQATVTYSFASAKGARALQDVGFNGLNDTEEQAFTSYQDFLNAAKAKVSTAVYDSIWNDPAADNYHYFRGSDLDRIEAPILQRYKYINNPQGNSPDNDSRTEGYDTSYKTTPDVEDINQDYTLNEYEKYYQYHISIRPEDLVVGRNYVVDKRETSPQLRNNNTEQVTWYQFRIPLSDFEKKVGGINDFTSIRFMRMFLTGFKRPIVLRFGNLDLVRGEWRVYNQVLDATAAQTGKLSMSAVNIEENNDKQPVNYVLPPGISRAQDPTQPQLVESNEQALALNVEQLGHNESKAVYKNTTLDLRQYRRMQMFVHANSYNPNSTQLQDNQLAVFVRLGSDYKSNYYEYEIPLKLTPWNSKYGMYSTTDRRMVWPEENMLDIPLTALTALKKARNKAKSEGMASYSRPYSAYDEKHPSNKITVMGNPTLGEVKTMVIGVRNLSSEPKSGEVWVNELRLKEFNNAGGWAAAGNLNMQLSDFGTVNLTGKYISNGFGGLEDGVAQRATDDYKTYSLTTNFDLGKFFPDKAKVTAPLYYSVTKEETRPRYNPLDTDMRLDDALDAVEGHERDSIESIAVTKTTNTNFSLSGVRVGIATKRHPMPYDPANFSFSYSHNHRYTSGETTVYEKEDNWHGSMNYTWTPVYKSFEPFKKIKNKSKWLDLPRRFGLNWLPQNISFNTDLQRSYYELQERDMQDMGGDKLPLTFNSQFLWNREFSIRWDLTKNLHMNFSSATHAEIEQPYTPVNKDLYADHYQAWKDSVWTSIKHFGTPLDYNQSFTASYKLPINLIPIFSWINADAQYSATYNWMRGSDLEDGTSLGNTIANNRQVRLNGTFNLERLYNMSPFLKKVNEKFSKDPARKKKTTRKPTALRGKNGKDDTNGKDSKQPNGRRGKNAADLEKQKALLPKNKKGFEKEVTLMPDTTITLQHGKHSKRLIVAAKTADGKPFKLKYRKTDANTLRIMNKVDSAMKLKITVTPKEPLDDKSWYKTLQAVARGLMMVRNINVSYSSQYSMALPGFMPSVGDAFGQKRNTGAWAPGLDFAFGLTGDSYIERARENGWLMVADSVATPATTNKTEDLQLRVTLEPVRNLKIDLNASRTQTKARSIQYMYTGTPTTESGTFSMTTLSLGSAFEGMGDAKKGYHSASFERFCNSLDQFRQRVEQRYTGTLYPEGSALAGKTFDPTLTPVNKYSADVMVPAFLSAYTSMGGKSLSLFPSLSRLLPNWSVRYSGLAKLPWVRDVFKSVNINHAYKSIYAVGAYQSYSTFMELMGPGMGFVSDATSGMPMPSSMYNVSTVSINEAFSPLLGIDMTFNNNLTCKIEYKSTRVLMLSMTSVQINESSSHDWVLGAGYTISNFNPFGPKARKIKGAKRSTDGTNANKNRSTNRSTGFNSDLKLRLDLSYRKQAALSRDIASMTSTASSGNTAFKLSFTAEYSLSRLLTMSFYYDRQTNTPLLTSSSYPTTTRDFGLSLKFSLTR